MTVAVRTHYCHLDGERTSALIVSFFSLFWCLRITAAYFYIAVPMIYEAGNTSVKSELAVLASVPFFIHATKGAARKYYLWSLHLYRVLEGMLFWLLRSLVNVVFHFVFYETGKKMRVDPCLNHWHSIA